MTVVCLFLGRSNYDQYRKVTYLWNVAGGDVEQMCQFNNDQEFPCECPVPCSWKQATVLSWARMLPCL